MNIAYLINQYPKVSHTFIRREIRSLEEAGIPVVRIAMRGWNDATIIDPADFQEREKTWYVLSGGILRLLRSVISEFSRQPILSLRSASLAYRMSRRSDRGLLTHFTYFAEACAIRQKLRSVPVSHIHVHFGTNAADVAMLVKSLGGPSWSLTIHGPEEFDRVASISLAEKLRSSEFVVAISSFCRSQIFRWLDPQSWHKVHVIRCGLDARFAEVHPRPPPRQNRFVCVGRLSAQKGQLLLLDAIKTLRDESIHIQMVFVGDGEMRVEIANRIQQLGLERDVIITGWLDEEGVQEQILNARAMILPSFAEGLPVVLFEAMALGRPVLTTSIAGIPELVRPFEHGWLVTAGDSEALVAALKHAIDSSPEQLADMGLRARSVALARHDIRAEGQKLASLFKSTHFRRPPDGS